MIKPRHICSIKNKLFTYHISRDNKPIDFREAVMGYRKAECPLTGKSWYFTSEAYTHSTREDSVMLHSEIEETLISEDGKYVRVEEITTIHLRNIHRVGDKFCQLSTKIKKSKVDIDKEYREFKEQIAQKLRECDCIVPLRQKDAYALHQALLRNDPNLKLLEIFVELLMIKPKIGFWVSNSLLEGVLRLIDFSVIDIAWMSLQAYWEKKQESRKKYEAEKAATPIQLSLLEGDEK